MNTMSDDRTHTIAVAQAVAVVDDVDRNLATLAGLIESAARQGADVVVTPELFATGYAPDRAWRHDGAAIRDALAAMAREHGIGLTASSVDSVSDAHHIAASFFSSEGEELTRVHKRHLFGGVEQQWITPAEAYGEPCRLARHVVGRWHLLRRRVPRIRALALGRRCRHPARAHRCADGGGGRRGAGGGLALLGHADLDAAGASAGARERGGDRVCEPLRPGVHGAQLHCDAVWAQCGVARRSPGVAVVTVPIGAIHASRRVNTYLNDLDRAFPPAQPKELP